MSLYKNRTRLIKNTDPLRIDYQPEEFHGIDEQQDQFLNATDNTYYGEGTTNLFLYGEPGTGKTSLTKYILQHLQTDAKEDHNVDITYIYHNCQGVTSAYQVTVSLFNKLRDIQDNPATDNDLPSNGHPTNVVFDKLFEELENLGGYIYLVLDEIDNINPKNNDDIFYRIPRARENEDLTENVDVGIIGISNDPGYLNKLQPKVKSSLKAEKIRFNPYNATELENILTPRAEAAFYDNTVNKDVVPLCAALAAQDDGNARTALDILHKAGNIAKSNSESTVTTDHVRTANKKLGESQVKETISESTIQTKLALLSVLTPSSTLGADWQRTKALYDKYTDLAKVSAHSPLSYDRYRDRLTALSQQEILTKEVKNDDGQYGLYKLNKDNTDLLAVLDVLAKEPEFHEPLKKRVAFGLHKNLFSREEISEQDNISDWA